jgi:flagellar biosynthesis/type III secretory pathway chaperone
MLDEDGVRRLRELLDGEREHCARLGSILDAERAAAAALDHAALLACLKEREGVLAAWRQAGDERQRLLRGAGETLQAVAARRTDLGEAVRTFRAEAARVRRAQRVNEGLIGAALAQVTDLLGVIRRALPDARYDGRAALTAAGSTVATRDWSA